MQKIFIAVEDFSSSVTRSRAKGYNKVAFGAGLESLGGCTFESDGTSLNISPIQASENEKEIYTIYCKEFGLVGINQGYGAKISVIFCDEGNMLVTLHEGCVIIKYNDSLVMPNVEMDKVPMVNESDICWVNAEDLLGYAKYLGTKGQFMYDFEFMFRVAGGKSGACNSFKFLHVEDETIDISLGEYANYLAKEQTRADAIKARRLREQLTGKQFSYEFDEDDTEEDSEDGDDDLSLYGFNE